MKKIICYGDSNTFGYNTKDCSRFDENTRWSALLRKIFENEFEVINEGVCDRTGFVSNPKGVLFSAQQHFPNFISNSENIDFLILWLGTNDLQFQYKITFDVVEKGLKNLIGLARERAKNIIVIPPVVMNEDVLNGTFNYQFDKTSIVKSRSIRTIFEQIADANNCNYFDLNTIVTPSDIDGIHYDGTSHKLIANELAKFIKEIC